MSVLSAFEGLGRDFGNSGRSLLAWWVEGLWAGVPEYFRQRLFITRNELIVRALEGDLVVTGCRWPSETIARVSAVELERGVSFAEKLVPMPESANVSVVLPERVRLTKTLLLPAAARADLRNVLYYELDRLMPLAVDQCVFDYAVRERDVDKGRIAVTFALVEKQTLEYYVSLVRRAGLTPSSVTATGEDGEILHLNLLGSRRRVVFPRFKVSPKRSVAVFAAIGVIAVLYLPLARYEALLKELEAAVEAERATAVEVRADLDADEARMAGIGILKERRERYVPPLDLLLELTEALPDDTWLAQFRLSSTGLEVRGESSAPSAILEIIESSAQLEHAQFRSPVSRSQTGKQQFSIAAQLVGE